MTIRQELERFVIERPVPDGHFEKVSLWSLVEGARAEAVKRLYAADRAVHSAYDGECEHGFGPPATLCPNDGCPDRELAEAWAALL
jgi:hypothetical protein